MSENYTISVEQIRETEEAYIYAVQVRAQEETHMYTVELEKEYYNKLTEGKVAPDELVRRSFEFLLAREKPYEILPEFELSVIEEYFSEYRDEVLK